ncbi:hypothetical protein VTJ04DRAFT_10188 [Mycothermus thermophilus]|uniref:uncharacterized protein n=1 Tax=Humicola insolens TaxID=85995 RepID=UPI003742D7A9
MPGRQAHGRPLLPGPANTSKKPGKSHARTLKKSRAKATAKALDAFAIAAEEIPESTKGVRTRGLEDRPSQKRPRRGDDDEEDDFDGFDDEDDAPRKKARRGDDDDDLEDGGDGSDSEEWHIGVGEDEDSEIDSDEAFGESDEERFDGYAFSGSSSKKKKKPKKKGEDEDEEEEEEDDEEDLESLGSDAIDLATALDQYEEDEDEDEEEGSSEEDDESADSDDESEDEDEVDPSKLDALENMIAGFGGDEEKEDEQPKESQGKTKLSLKDLGLTGIKDENIKKSVRLMSKEEKATKPGSSKKLEVPLAKRQQDKLLRSAAYEKTTETLDRWIETVKYNRRAEHLVFPLAQNAHDRGLSTGELMPITQKTSGTELEQTILAIMEESGLGPSATPQQKNDGEPAPKLTQAEIQEIARQRRRERELHSREMARLKRIKKIKSKTWRRIHRKEMKRLEEAELEAKLEAGELDSEEEREALDRRRALERVGTRLRESKWAKLGKKAGRAVWDENFRASLTEEARRKEDLRRRIEGRKAGSDDEDDDSDSDASGEGDPREKLRRELEKAAAYESDDEPKSKLMQMKFMQRAEEQRKKENDAAIAELRRQLDSDGEEVSEEETEVGRRQFGMGNGNTVAAVKTPQVSKPKAAVSQGSAASTGVSSTAAVTNDSAPAQSNAQTNGQSGGAWTSTTEEPSAPAAAGVWTQVESDKKSKKAAKTRAAEIDIASATLVAAQSKPKPKPKAQTAEGSKAQENGAQDSEEEEYVSHLPMAIRDQKLIERAFAGEDVHGQFEEEKAEAEAEDDEKEIDNTLPGWGSWVGEGVSKREQRKHKGRFVTKVEGVKKTDRKDYKLKGVIISEKRIKKNDKYLASQLPHPFESQHQYERSLRLPVGPEWSTKETFQDNTKPRVIIKQGIIAPMSKPMY